LFDHTLRVAQVSIATLAHCSPAPRLDHAQGFSTSSRAGFLALEFATAIEHLTGADLGLDLGQASPT